jgi:thiol-disulfide isomerase/thioredoxin
MSCIEKKSSVFETRLKELDKLKTEATKIHDTLQHITGSDYLAGHDKYYELTKKRTLAAMSYLDTSSFDDLSMQDLKNIANIAVYAQDEQKIVDVLKVLFTRFPESKNDKALIQSYFTSAYLLEPGQIDKYVDFTIFPPSEQLYCYYMLALGFSENGNTEQAKTLNDRAKNLHKTILSDSTQKSALPEAYIVGLRSFIEYRLGNTKEAYNVIEEAKKTFTDTPTLNQLDAYTKRLNIMEGKIAPIEYQNWIGTNQPIDLVALKGKVILLDFFAWDCETCTNSLPNLNRLKEQVNNENFVIIGITKYLGGYENELNISEEREYELMRNHFYTTRKIGWPVCISRTAMVDYGITAIPTLVVIDKSGKLKDGYFASNYAYLIKKINALLESN